MSNDHLMSKIGDRGLVLYDGKNYYTVNEDKWRELERHEVPVAGSGTPSVPGLDALIHFQAAVALLSAKPDANVFVDLERLARLPETKGSKALREEMGHHPKLTKVPPLKGRNIVVREADCVFVVPENLWGTPVPPAACGDARVLVNRGTLVAAIPQNQMPVGTWCVLVNIAALVKPAPTTGT